MGALLCNFFSIAISNFFGINVTRFFSASHRVIVDSTRCRCAGVSTRLDARRSVTVWMIALGLKWETFSYVEVLAWCCTLPPDDPQLIGFFVLCSGTLTFNTTIPSRAAKFIRIKVRTESASRGMTTRRSCGAPLASRPCSECGH